MYNYDYKYDGIVVKGETMHDYGFIIDELEDTDTISKYIKNYDKLAKIENNTLIDYSKDDAEHQEDYNFHYKKWNRDSYIKMLFILIKSLQVKIDELEEKIKEKEGQ